MKVYAIQQGAGKTGPVAGNGLRRTGAGMAGVGTVAAGAGIHGRDQHEVRRIGDGIGRTGDGHRALLQRLTQDFERLPLELGKLVQKQHAMMGKAHLPGMRRHTAADDGHAGIAVMGRAERPLRHKSMPVEQARYAVDLGDFQSLFKTEGRKNAGHTLGQHGLAASGRPDEQKVVRPGSRYLHSPLGALLPLHVGKVQREARERLRGVRLAGGKLGLPHKEGHGLAQSLRGKHGKPFHHGGLPGILGGRDEPAGLLASGKERKGEHTGNRLQPAVQRKFGRREPAVQHIRRNDAGCRQQAEGQRQIVGRAFLAAVGRGKVHCDAGSRKLEAGILQGLEHTLPGFAHRAFGKAHHHEGRHTLPTAIDLEIDPVGVNAVESAAG